MKLRTLIKRLQKMLDKHGDVDVCILNERFPAKPTLVQPVVEVMEEDDMKGVANPKPTPLILIN